MNWYDLVSSLSETESHFGVSKRIKILRASHLLCGNEKKSPTKIQPKPKPIQTKVCFKKWDINSLFQMHKLILGCTSHKAARTQDLYMTHLCEFALLGLHFNSSLPNKKAASVCNTMHLQMDGKIKNHTNEKPFGGQKCHSVQIVFWSIKS